MNEILIGLVWVYKSERNVIKMVEEEVIEVMLICLKMKEIEINGEEYDELLERRGDWCRMKFGLKWL